MCFEDRMAQDIWLYIEIDRPLEQSGVLPASVIGKKEERTVARLFSPGGTPLDKR